MNYVFGALMMTVVFYSGNYFFDSSNHYANQDDYVTNYCLEEEFNKKLNEG